MKNMKMDRAQSRCLRRLGLWGAAGVGVALGLVAGQPWIQAVEAQTPSPASTQPAPQGVTDLLQQLDAASSSEDTNAVLKFYSPNFTHSDGLNLTTLRQAVTAFWKDAKNLKYATKVDAWQVQGDRYILDATTTIQGIQQSSGRDLTLASIIKSKTAIVNQQIVSQEILSEQTRLTTGDKAPVVEVKLPLSVNVGQTFNFDAVVKSPIGDDLLLGAAIEEPISPNSYLQPTQVVLDPLAAGGLFKTGQAPQQPTREWISAVLIQEGGMTIVSQRLNVVRPSASSPR